MLRIISDLLHQSPGLKGRQIAKELKLDKSQVNSFLHKNQDTFVKNSDHEWYLIQTQHVEIDFATGWIDAKDFEAAIGKLVYHKDISKVTFRFGAECKFLLIAL
ncbi:ATP-binding protein, partial [Klebsiella pneumoniae]|nr:ATP-binding protein [Klebsiella pneumoniae]